MILWLKAAAEVFFAHYDAFITANRCSSGPDPPNPPNQPPPPNPPCSWSCPLMVYFPPPPGCPRPFPQLPLQPYTSTVCYPAPPKWTMLALSGSCCSSDSDWMRDGWKRDVWKPSPSYTFFYHANTWLIFDHWTFEACVWKPARHWS